MSINPRNLLRLTLVCAIFVVILPKLFAGPENPELMALWAWPQKLLGLVLMTGLGASFWVLTAERRQLPHSTLVLVLIGFQFVVGMLFGAEPLFLIAFELPMAFKARQAKKWFLIFVSLLVVVWLVWLPLAAPGYQSLFLDAGFREQVYELIVITTFLTFAFSAGYVLNNEVRARHQLEEAQDIIRRQSKIEERQAISRELHDSMGHHLTILKIQLDIAQRQSDGDLQTKLKEALGLVKRLIAEVRSVVEDLSERELAPFNLSLQKLTGGIVNPAIDLRLPDPMPHMSRQVHLTLFRCVQECLTNTIKHARASEFVVDLQYRENVFELRIHDNGKGVEKPVFGNGLTGLKERVSLSNGTLETNAPPAGGFEIHIIVPESEANHVS